MKVVVIIVLLVIVGGYFISQKVTGFLIQNYPELFELSQKVNSEYPNLKTKINVFPNSNALKVEVRSDKELELNDLYAVGDLICSELKKENNMKYDNIELEAVKGNAWIKTSPFQVETDCSHIQ